MVQAEKETANAVRNLNNAGKNTERAERIASLGTMAAGMAHEINQPLNALNMIVNEILFWHKRRKIFEHDELMEEIKAISAQADRIDRIIKSVRSIIQGAYSLEFTPAI